MYALVTLAVLIAVYAPVPAWQQGGVGAWVVCSGALLAALYLDYNAFYVYSALVIWFGVVGRRRAPTAPSSISMGSCSRTLLWRGRAWPASVPPPGSKPSAGSGVSGCLKRRSAPTLAAAPAGCCPARPAAAQEPRR
jgi:hypothetical protein